MNTFAIIAIFASCFLALTLSGNVEYARCGGVGTFRALRIDNCQGPVCWMNPGSIYLCEGDLMPSSAAPGLLLSVTTFFRGFNITLVETNLPNSSVQPGFVYTIKFAIVPNDVLAGEYLPVEAALAHMDTLLQEICVGFHVRVNPLNSTDIIR